jgi:plastocyanin
MTRRPDVHRWRRLLGAAVVVVVSALAGCGDDDGSGGDGAALPADAVTTRAVRVVGTEMAFTPGTLTVTAGEHDIVFVNEGAVHHELLIADGEEFVGRVSAPAGEEATMTVDLEPGTYEMSCHEPGHYEAGMNGTLVVV